MCFVQLTPYVNSQFEEVFRRLGSNVKHSLITTQCVIMAGFIVVLFVEEVIKFIRRRSKEKKLAVSEAMIPLQSEMLDSADDDPDVTMCEKKFMLKMEARSTMPLSQSDTQQQGHAHSEHAHSHIAGIVSDTSLDIRTFLLLGALSLHSFFEGMAIGLQNDLPKLINLFVGVVVHEVLVAFAVGINLVQQQVSMTTIVKLSIFFSLIIPVGTVIGLVVEFNQKNLAGLVTSATLQGLAAGTFIYVAFFDILPHEFCKPHNELYKIFFFVLGFSVVSALSFAMMGHH